jgi:uncharacterized metal-binding protein YceD (DUF177 family)
MPLRVNLRHLEVQPVRLQGELSPGELDIDTRDDVIQLGGPLDYDLEAQKLEGGLLVQGRLSLLLHCQCVRCLKKFELPLKISPWTCHLPFQGEDAVEVINDCVDLTPILREDILLEFPRHPLCDTNCNGLRNASIGKSKTFSKIGSSDEGSPAWKELNKLKF